MKGETQLLISVSATGDVNVSGPIGDKLLCYGLLGIARDLIRDYQPSTVIVPKGVVIPPLSGVGRGN